MNPFLQTVGRFFRDFFISILLWVYAGLVIFTWHIARNTPEWAVLLRVAASVMNDLVWIPLGVLVWSYGFLILWRHVQPGSADSFRFRIFVITATVLMHLMFTDIAFKFVFVPLAFISIVLIRNVFQGRKGVHLFGWYIPLLAVIILTVAHYQGQMIPGRKIPHSPRELKVMSYNIFYDGGHQDRMKVLHTIRKENPDIVCCIEFNFKTDSRVFNQGIGALYPYTLRSDDSDNTKSGSIVFSKYPLKTKKIQGLKAARGKWSSHVSLIFAEVDVDGRKISLVNYHLKSVGHFIEYVADKNFAIKEKIDWAAKNEEKNDLEKYIQAQSLVELISSLPEPIVLCGDLNDTPNSRAFHMIQKHYKNTFSDRGWGLGDTFGELRIKDYLERFPLIPYLARDVIRIDHIFVSRDIRINSAWVVNDAAGSDHKPVVSILEFD